jgi:hypothetical protein
MSNVRRKPTKKDADATPIYMTSDGVVDISKAWKWNPKQEELFRDYEENGHLYKTLAAPQNLFVGGFRSGKTTGALMFGVIEFCLKFAHCDILVLRRTFRELESGAISDLKAFVPSELFSYNPTLHVATFLNGSRIVFGHCSNLLQKDIMQYLGSSYPYILVDECGQFSPEAWLLLSGRNAVNAGCEPDEFGTLPTPCMIGATNPIGPFWTYYKTVFLDSEPWEKPDGARKDTDGTWWIPEGDRWTLIHDPKKYASSHSTLFDNPAFMKRDPGYVAKLQALPKALRDKQLWGFIGTVEGQYYDCWDKEFHVVNLRENPDQILFQDWNPVWAGQDWGLSHANAVYMFTQAMVLHPITNQYSLKTVCFKELVVTGGKTHKVLAQLVASSCKLPDGRPFKLSALYFSHEKFARQVSEHSPAEEYSRELRSYGLPGVTRGTQDRVGSATFIYNLLKSNKIVILDTCPEIINALPSLMRNPNCLEDVLKTNAKSDDAYDGFRLGIWGQLATKARPEKDRIMEKAATLDPLARFWYLRKQEQILAEKKADWAEVKRPIWEGLI